MSTTCHTTYIALESKEVSQVSLGKESTLTGVLQNLIGKRSFKYLPLVNLFFNRPGCNEAVDSNWIFLTKPPSPLTINE